MRDLVGEYLAEIALGRRPRTVRLRRYQLRDWERWVAPGDVCDAQRGEVVRYLTQWRDPGTRASRRDALSGFYRWARIVGEVRQSPVELIEIRGRAAPDPQPIPDEVLTAALAEAGEVERRALTLGRFAGLRAGEIAAVHTRDLDVRPDHLRVVGKGGKVRYVPVHDEVQQLLRDADGFVFPGRGGGHWTASPIVKRVSAALPATWTCHNLRHAFATALYEECRDWAIVQDALGHASMDTTRRYVLLRPERAVAAVRRLTLAQS